MTKDGWNKDVLIAENAMLIECQNAQLEELRQENERLKKEVMDWRDGSIIVMYEKQIAELEDYIRKLLKENEVLRRALRNSVIDADFYKYGSQSTTDENIKRILRLEEQYIQQAKGAER